MDKNRHIALNNLTLVPQGYNGTDPSQKDRALPVLVSWSVRHKSIFGEPVLKLPAQDISSTLQYAEVRQVSLTARHVLMNQNAHQLPTVIKITRFNAAYTCTKLQGSSIQCVIALAARAEWRQNSQILPQHDSNTRHTVNTQHYLNISGERLSSKRVVSSLHSVLVAAYTQYHLPTKDIERVDSHAYKTLQVKYTNVQELHQFMSSYILQDQALLSNKYSQISLQSAALYSEQELMTYCHRNSFVSGQDVCTVFSAADSSQGVKDGQPSYHQKVIGSLQSGTEERGTATFADEQQIDSLSTTVVDTRESNKLAPVIVCSSLTTALDVTKYFVKSTDDQYKMFTVVDLQRVDTAAQKIDTALNDNKGAEGVSRLTNSNIAESNKPSVMHTGIMNTTLRVDGGRPTIVLNNPLTPSQNSVVKRSSKREQDDNEREDEQERREKRQQRYQMYKEQQDEEDC